MIRFFCVAALSLLMNVLPVSAQTTGDKSWYDNSKKEFTLSTAVQLKGLAELVENGNNFAGKSIYLSKDISLTAGAWMPIGTASTPFCGNFDGSGFSVTLGEVEAGRYGGLFGVVGNGTVQNLNVTINSVQESVEMFGAVVGRANSGSTVSFCSSRGVLTVNEATLVGGIAGMSEGEITSCVNYCDVSSQSTKNNAAGGIAGSSNGVIAKSYNAGTVSGTNLCGGILGQNASTFKQVSIWNCHNQGAVSANSGAQDNNEAVVGGIGGKVENAEMEQCYNVGSVNAYCYKTGNSASNCRAYAGGLIGMGNGKLKNSYNVGMVATRSVSDISDRLESLSYSYTGGLLGYLSGNDLSSITYCYNAGGIYTFGKSNNRSYMNSGGVLGDFASFAPSLTCCYYLADAIKTDAVKSGIYDTFTKDVGILVSGEELSSAHMLNTKREIKGLNDDEVFVHDDGYVNHGYPICQTVQTFGLTRSADGGTATLKGYANVPCASQGFLYWYGGYEDYAVDQKADASFEKQIEMPKKSEDLYVQAYVILSDGNLVKGNVLKVHIPDL